MKTFAFYLPQFHPDEMNDFFWGKDFTDWVTTKAAKPLFKQHAQPHIPTKLGYYDLSDPDIIANQSRLAIDHGIDGFGVYNYIFDENTTALSTPLNNLRNNPSIEIEYFICWVNADWSKVWVGDPEISIYKQVYSIDLYKKVASNATFHFEDSRYFRLDNKPVFYIHEPRHIEIKEFKEVFMNIASKNGFHEILFAAPQIHVLQEQQDEFDYLLGYPPGDFPLSPFKIDSEKFKVINKGVFSFSKYAAEYPALIKPKFRNKKFIPTVLSGWDNTPRYKENGFVFHDFDHETFSLLFSSVLNDSIESNRDFLMVKAWNEWAEGNILEPSVRHGNKLLESIKRSMHGNAF